MRLYEIFEHLAPQDMLPVFQNLYKFVKKDGNNIDVRTVSRAKYEKLGRSRWRWFDHRNFFQQAEPRRMFLRTF